MAVTDLTGMAADTELRGLQYKTRSYLFNGRNRMRKCDGLTFNFAGIAGMDFTPALATSGNGPLLGKYRYFVQPVNSRHFNLNGQVVAGIPSALSLEIYANSNSVAVSGIPTHADPQVDYWHVFRNQADAYVDSVEMQVQTFYYVGRVANGNSSFLDDVPDEFLSGLELLRFNQAVPPACQFGELYGERMFLGGFEPVTGTVIFSSDARTITHKEKLVSETGVRLTTSTANGFVVGQTVGVGMTTPDALLDGARVVSQVISSTVFMIEPTTVYATTGSTAAPGLATGYRLQAAVAPPDGMLGAWIRLASDTHRYRVIFQNGSTLITDGPLVPGGSTAYTIYRDPWEVYFTEFGDMEACGLDAFAGLNRRELPGRDHFKGMIAFQGALLVFSPTNIYTIVGKGPQPENVQILPDPLFKGLGCVSGKAICAVDNQAYFMSLRGPCVLDAGASAPRLIGLNLNTDWLDSLDAAEMNLICCGTNGRFVWFSVPVSGGSECSRTFRYDRRGNSWWEETGMFPRFFYTDDGDDGRQGEVYFAQGRLLIQPDSGTKDLVDADISGTLTGKTTLTATDSGTTFPTAAQGLEERVVHFARGLTYLGFRRIISNTNHTLTWSASAAGGGVLALAIGDTYFIGPQRWTWQSKTWEYPGHSKQEDELKLTFESRGAERSVIKTDVLDDVTATVSHESDAQQRSPKLEVNLTNVEYAAILESRNRAVLRHFQVVTTVSEGDQE